MATQQRAEDISPFVEVLSRINRGAALGEASLALSAVTQAVQATGRAGKVVLTVNVKPFKGNGAMVTVDVDVASKEPKQEAHAGVFFADEQGALTRNDPRQGTLLDGAEGL